MSVGSWPYILRSPPTWVFSNMSHLIPHSEFPTQIVVNVVFLTVYTLSTINFETHDSRQESANS